MHQAGLFGLSEQLKRLSDCPAGDDGAGGRF
jgi:hypothetical protein